MCVEGSARVDLCVCRSVIFFYVTVRNIDVLLVELRMQGLLLCACVFGIYGVVSVITAHVSENDAGSFQILEICH